MRVGPSGLVWLEAPSKVAARSSFGGYSPSAFARNQLVVIK